MLLIHVFRLISYDTGISQAKFSNIKKYDRTKILAVPAGSALSSEHPGVCLPIGSHFQLKILGWDNMFVSIEATFSRTGQIYR